MYYAPNANIQIFFWKLILIKIVSERIYCKCRSCGTESELDNKHKVAPFIIKNPHELGSKNIKVDIEEN